MHKVHSIVAPPAFKRPDMAALTITPYWNINVPVSEHTLECPDFLVGVQGKDLRTVSTPDSDYHIQTWDEVVDLISSNNLKSFQRIPSQLRRYKAFQHQRAQKYGSIANYVLEERLQWKLPIEVRGKPFQYEEDYKILYNDWPYGLDSRIVHLVVWTKFELKAVCQGGDMTDQTRAEIDAFIDKTFRSRMPPGTVSSNLSESSNTRRQHANIDIKVMWFKNWSSLKSIHAVEHLHVMLFNPDPEFMREVTGGDIPPSAQIEF